MTAGDAALADHLRMLRVHGSKERYVHDEIGYNSRLDELQAAVLRVKLPHVDGWNAQRAQVARWYGESLAGLAQVVTPSAPGGYVHIYHQYVIRAERRDELKAFLQARGVGSMIYYPIPLHQQVCFRFLGYRDGDLPHTEKAAREVLALPVFFRTEARRGGRSVRRDQGVLRGFEVDVRRPLQRQQGLGGADREAAQGGAGLIFLQKEGFEAYCPLLLNPPSWPGGPTPVSRLPLRLAFAASGTACRPNFPAFPEP